MRILACTDGSKQSEKAIAKAVEIASGCSADQVTIIHVYEDKLDLSSLPSERGMTVEDKEAFYKLQEEHKKKRESILEKALQVFAGSHLQVDSLLKEGHPANTILQTAREGGYDTIVIGSRGLGGLKKAFLGSVSNAIIQEAEDCSVVVVK